MTAKTATPKPAANGHSNRLLVFKALRKAPGLTSTALRKKIGMPEGHGQMGVILRGEIICGRIRVEEHADEDGTERLYFLTAKGKQHCDDGKVDSFAKERHLAAVGRGEAAE